MLYELTWYTLTTLTYESQRYQESRKGGCRLDAKLMWTREILLTPIQRNYINITHSFLVKKCYSHWIKYFFHDESIQLLDSGMIKESMGNTLSRCNGGLVIQIHFCVVKRYSTTQNPYQEHKVLLYQNARMMMPCTGTPKITFFNCCNRCTAYALNSFGNFECSTTNFDISLKFRCSALCNNMKSAD